jgi:hypothetical protein
MVKVSVAEPVPPELIAPNVTVEVPAVVGVPVILPVVEEILSPDGRPVAVKLVGVLVAVTV